MLPKTAVVTGYLAAEYHARLQGAILVRIEHLKTDKIFRFSFKTDDKCHLEFSFAPPHFLLMDGWAKKDDSFEIWQECAGTQVIGVKRVPGNRAMTFEIEKKDEAEAPWRLKIVFELFGAQATAFLLNSDGLILHALRVVRDARKLRPGVSYVTAETVEVQSQSGRVEIAAIDKVNYQLEYDGPSYRVFTNPLTNLDLRRETPLISLFQQLHIAQAEQQEIKQVRATALGVLTHEIRRNEKTLTQLQQDISQCNNVEKLRQWGDLLMANLNGEPEGNALRVVDFYHNDAAAIVPLLSGKNILESAASYYKRAKRLQRMPAIIAPRIQKIEQTIGKLNERAQLLNDADTLEELQNIAASLRSAAAKRSSSVAAAPSDTSKHYRVFLSSAGEKLLVGKSAAGNDVLTFKVARTYDWWFHAQQAAGSHVVLVVADKNRAPTKRSITEAAQLAAFYSDLKKSSHVPVMYAERRYIRKAKGGIPGKVTFQQIKSVFVDPQLPPTATEEKVDL